MPRSRREKMRKARSHALLATLNVYRDGGLATRAGWCRTIPSGGERMGCYVLGFQEIDRTHVGLVGGKGAHLGELSRLEGVRVPEGFCITTDAFAIMAEAPAIDDRLDRLSGLKPDDKEPIGALSAEIRQILEAVAIPDD